MNNDLSFYAKKNFTKWTSENKLIDEFIQKVQIESKNRFEFIEWIEYERFDNVEYLTKGGFGDVYKATWKDGYIEGWDSKNDQWKRCNKNKKVALKCLHNSENVNGFLEEIRSCIKTHSVCVIQCFGITKIPKTKEFMMVMEYAENGDLRNYLNDNFNLLGWKEKLDILYKIASGLNIIHYKELIHRDFHCGNILCKSGNTIRIADLGLSKSAKVKNSNKKLCGVLPYMAPEVLKGKRYTQASDIYGFGIIAYEVCTGLRPYRYYYDMAYESLIIKICKGERPKSNYKVPKVILNIIERCWNADPLKRPKAFELPGLIKEAENLLINNNNNNNNADYSFETEYPGFKDSLMIDFTINSKQLSSSTSRISSYSQGPQAVYTSSKHSNFKNLIESKNIEDYYSTDFKDSLMIDFSKS